jgi:hypothetical protein
LLFDQMKAVITRDLRLEITSLDEAQCIPCPVSEDASCEKNPAIRVP